MFKVYFISGPWDAMVKMFHDVQKEIYVVGPTHLDDMMPSTLFKSPSEVVNSTYVYRKEQTIPGYITNSPHDSVIYACVGKK